MALAAEDPRSAFISSLDLSSCRVEFLQSPIVLVCGGPVPLKTHAEADDPPTASLRHALSKTIPKFDIFRPEEIQDWHGDAIFKDLVSFELALASICSLIVIILESAGSMAELGAFSQLPELADKSITICSDNFSDDTSFINFGILRFLAERNSSRVKSYPWDTSSPMRITDELVSDVISDIDIELEKLPSSSTFRRDQDAHCMVAISELLRLFTALKENEIHDYLGQMGFPISTERLRGNLFLLRQFRIVQIQRYSDAVFYMTGSAPFHRLRLSSSDKSKAADALRIETLCLEFYRTDPKQKNRQRVISKSAVASSAT
jgi:hypothetical protein